MRSVFHGAHQNYYDLCDGRAHRRAAAASPSPGGPSSTLGAAACDLRNIFLGFNLYLYTIFDAKILQKYVEMTSKYVKIRKCVKMTSILRENSHRRAAAASPSPGGPSSTLGAAACDLRRLSAETTPLA